MARPTVLFFSDVHLASDRPERCERLVRFLEGPAREAGEIVCLGDLFDVWLGPEHVRVPDYKPALRALGELVASGVPVAFVHGNRDFHVGKELERELGVRVVRDRVELSMDGIRIYGCHGDLLCTGDRRYQIYRRIVRSGPARAVARAVPFPVAYRVAQGMRAASRREIAAKTQAEMSIANGALESLVRAGWDAIVCGHVHREGTLDVRSGARVGRVYTLGDWDAKGRYLAYENGRFEFREVS
ncbi:MAG: UDP-2,3-diacylglucosamine diphosphatase [Planctomycetes bacterium]|nr:UDP-2,3-diacylglucosamine diphosphatase [Planctomycetota bacterium]